MDYNVEPTPELNQPPQHLNTGRTARKFNKKRMVIIAGAVAVALLIAAAAFFLLVNKKDSGNSRSDSNQQNSSVTNDVSDEPAMPAAEAAQLVTYKSTKMNIEITHRKDWKVKEATDRTQLTLTSPKVTYQTADGTSKQGVFTLKIGTGATDVEQKTLDDAKIVKDSLLIGYDAPTESQRHYTNVSYAGEDTAFQFFIVTGSQALKSGAPLGVLIGDADFLIAGGFGADAHSTLSFDSVDPATVEQNTGYEQALAIVKSLKVF